MSENRGWVSQLLFLVLSIVGLLLVPLMVIRLNLEGFGFAGQRFLVGSLFCTLCIFGVAAVFYPVRCNRVFSHALNSPTGANTHSYRTSLEGHHPNCQNFSKNRISVSGRVFCAACSGLLVGALIALIGASLYFFYGVSVTWGGIWLVVLGEVCMLLGLAQIKFGGFAKLMLNVLLVVGSFVTLAVVDAIERSLILDLYVLGLILFILWFRISLSEYSNRQTCQTCQLCFH